MHSAVKSNITTLPCDATPDAELLRIGAAFDIVNAEWLRARDLYRALTRDPVVVDLVNQISDQSDILAERILGIEPQTLAGCAIQARAVGNAFAGSWDDEPEELDWKELAARRLVENVCRLAGVDRFGGSI